MQMKLINIVLWLDRQLGDVFCNADVSYGLWKDLSHPHWNMSTQNWKAIITMQYMMWLAVMHFNLHNLTWAAPSFNDGSLQSGCSLAWRFLPNPLNGSLIRFPIYFRVLCTHGLNPNLFWLWNCTHKSGRDRFSNEIPVLSSSRINPTRKAPIKCLFSSCIYTLK